MPRQVLRPRRKRKFASGRRGGLIRIGAALCIPRRSRADSTKPSSWRNISTRSRSTLRSTSRRARRSPSSGSNAWPRFQFTAKLWQRFTHEGGGSAEDERLVREGFAPLVAAKKLGAVLMQFPFSFHNTPENSAYLKQLFERFGDYCLVVEVRHGTWNDKEFFAMLHSHGVGFCNIDQPVIGRSLKPTERATSPVGYIRLHGRRYDTWFSDDPQSPPEERYNYLYNEEELAPWANRVRHVSEHSRSTYVITNNHYLGKGAVNALQLISLLSGAQVKVPEPLREHYPQLNKIADQPQREPTLFPNPIE